MSSVWRSGLPGPARRGWWALAAWLVFFSSRARGAGDRGGGQSRPCPPSGSSRWRGWPRASLSPRWTWPRSRDRVGRIRQIESVVVSRGWPGTLRSRSWSVSRWPRRTGRAQGRADRPARGGDRDQGCRAPRLPVLRVDRPGADDPATVAALTVMRALPADLAARVAEVLAPSAETVDCVSGRPHGRVGRRGPSRRTRRGSLSRC